MISFAFFDHIKAEIRATSFDNVYIFCFLFPEESDRKLKVFLAVGATIVTAATVVFFSNNGGFKVIATRLAVHPFFKHIIVVETASRFLSSSLLGRFFSCSSRRIYDYCGGHTCRRCFVGIHTQNKSIRLVVYGQYATAASLGRRSLRSRGTIRSSRHFGC